MRSEPRRQAEAFEVLRSVDFVIINTLSVREHSVPSVSSLATHLLLPRLHASAIEAVVAKSNNRIRPVHGQ